MSEFYERLGTLSPFDKKNADFSGLDASNKSYISLIQHKAFIDVNEGGVEAGAATGIGIELAALFFDEPIEFNCNRPFIYFIHDKKNLLFIGKLHKPNY